MKIKEYTLHLILTVLILSVGFLINYMTKSATSKDIVFLITCIAVFFANIYYHAHSSKLTKYIVLEYLLISTLIYFVYFYISLF